MPLPFILGALAIGAGAVGVKKGIDAHEKNNKAKRIYNNARSMHEKSKNNLEKARKLTNNSLENLGKLKLDVMSNNINRFVRAFSQIHNIELATSRGIEELRRLNISKEELEEMKKMVNFSLEMSSGVAQGSVAGGLAALGAYGGAMTFGVASTGTAISGLAGAAATNATLAFLGGGSLAAGGLGMAGGMAVLGGLVAGPALAILGFTMNSKAEENLEEARTQYAEVEKACEEIKLIIDRCNKITERTDMFTDLLRNLNVLFGKIIYQLEGVILNSGKNYRYYGDDEKNIVGTSMALAKAIKSVIDTSILTKDGDVDSNTTIVLNENQKLLNSMGA